jgi:hypothetical protein
MLTQQAITIIKECHSNNLGLLEKYQSELASLPPFNLNVKNIKGHICCYKYLPSKFRYKRGKITYIKNSEKVLLKQLYYKRFITTSIAILKKAIAQEEKFLESYIAYDPLNVIGSLPQIPALCGYNPLACNISEDSDKLIHWLNEPFEHSCFHPEQLTYTTSAGLKVRSKSELIIAEELIKAKIPFRYESPLTLEDITFYPDFTIYNPLTNQFLYWEHFGLLDNPKYVMSMNNKIAAYKRNKILPNYNLIETYEIKDVPFDIQLIRKIIRDIFFV